MGVKGLKSVLREIFPNFAGLDILDLSLAVSLRSRNFDGKLNQRESGVDDIMDYNLNENYIFYLVDSILIPAIVIIFRGTLTSEDVHWNIKLGAVHLAFPRDAVSEPTLITVYRWKPTILSQPLQEHEALVSNVIEISSNSREAFKFEAEVKMSFTHSSRGLHG